MAGFLEFLKSVSDHLVKNVNIDYLKLQLPIKFNKIFFRESTNIR